VAPGGVLSISSTATCGLMRAIAASTSRRICASPSPRKAST
jgi:hypothetical protein